MMWYVLWWLEVQACVLQRVCQVWELGGLGNTEIHVPTTLAKARARPEPVSADPPMPMKEGKESGSRLQQLLFCPYSARLFLRCVSSSLTQIQTGRNKPELLSIACESRLLAYHIRKIASNSDFACLQRF